MSKALADLQTEMRRCRVCKEKGYDIIPGAVFRGAASAEVLLIGQAPGVTEVEAKRPFNAGSGRRLFQWLGEAGWDEKSFRARHYMTAVTKCYPGRHPSGKGDRVPSKVEQLLCRPFLEQEIRLVDPRLMILVGGLAIKLIYPKTWRLNQIVGTAIYFAPDTLTDPLDFDFNQGILSRHFDPQREKNGRWVVPLPHPSGASLWPNKLENKRLIANAIDILAAARLALKL